MSSYDASLRKRERPTSLRGDIATLLEAGTEAAEVVRRRAHQTKLAIFGAAVWLRGLVEISNRCVKDCLYCGLRRELPLHRYTMSEDEVMECVGFAQTAGYGTVVLQAGEQRDAKWVDGIERLVARIRAAAGDELAITLSLGEQTRETYLRWRAAGADRYLLRIETSNPQLYRAIHPPGHEFAERIRCLRDIAEAGYQLGSGILVGLPGQTTLDLADDLLFLREAGVDMIGMGPYVVHAATPLAGVGDSSVEANARLALALRMISIARLLMPDVNIAAATALDALHPRGRDLGLLAGANVVMPVVTPPAQRRHYVLYDGRPGLGTDAHEARASVVARLDAIGAMPAFGARGDRRH
jgi:biotin synthase